LNVPKTPKGVFAKGARAGRSDSVVLMLIK